MPISSNLGYSAIARPGVCTSSTRPSSPYEGQYIYETDTDKTLFWNGSAWVQSATFDASGNLNVGTSTVSRKVNIDAGTSGGIQIDATDGAGLNVRSSNGGTKSWDIGNYYSTWFGTASPFIVQPINGSGTMDMVFTPVTNSPSTGLVIKASGAVTKNSQPAFLVHTGGYNHPGAWVDISTLGGAANRTVDYNVGNGWNSTTGLFTAPVTGYYLFYAGGWANYNGAGNRYAISFHINAAVGGDWTYISGANTSAVDTPIAMSPVIRYMTSGQYMRTAMFSSVAMQLGTSSHKFYYGGYLLG
jgi:hypothetical protein